jgi:hypothetical protein
LLNCTNHSAYISVNNGANIPASDCIDESHASLHGSVAITVLVNLLVTGPILAYLSDLAEGYVRRSIAADLRTLEPIFRQHFVDTLGAQVDVDSGGSEFK